MNAIHEKPVAARPVHAAVASRLAQPPPQALVRSPAAPAARGVAAQRINLLGELAGGIAHDFRNVLAVISSALNLAERQDDDSKREEYLAAARLGVERGIGLTSKLLALAKPHAPDLHPEDPANLVRELLPFLEYGAGPQVRVRHDLASDKVRCLVDPPQFNQALLNLVVNARDAMPEGGEIVIRSDVIPGPGADGQEPGRRFLRLRVSDTGAGMPEEVAARIFDPWFTTKGETGTGLGLPQVARFVDSIGGSISVASAPGLGSVFDLLFPIEEAAATAPASLS